MTDVLTSILVALIGAIATIAAAVVVEVIKHWRQSRGVGQVGSLIGSILFSLLGLAVLIGMVGWIGVLLFRPVASAQITKPEDYTGGETLPALSTVVVEYRDIPSDHYVWVVVRDPRVRPMRMAYPQLTNGMPTPVTGTGRFETTISLGGPTDSEVPFNIVVMLLDQKANQAFVRYSEDCIDEGVCGGITLPYPGAEILDFITVMRQ